MKSVDIHVYGDRARIKMRTGILVRLLGLPFLLFGGWMLYHFAAGLIEYVHGASAEEWLSALPGFLLTLVFTAIFLAPGVMLCLFRMRVELDRAKGTVTHVKDFLFYRWTRKMPIKDIRQIVARQTSANRSRQSAEGFSGNRSKMTVYPVDIEFETSDSMGVSQSGEKAEAKKIARGLAEFLGVPLNDRL